jgi:hypothetical protein
MEKCVEGLRGNWVRKRAGASCSNSRTRQKHVVRAGHLGEAFGHPRVYEGERRQKLGPKLADWTWTAAWG